MLSNFHTHSTFCDGKNTPEEIVRYAIENGFYSIGFSSHGYTAFDLRYCMKDIDGYIKNITELKNKYKGKIQIYLGVEEDAFSFMDRSRFDYIIGSSHYFCINGVYYPFDSSLEHFKKCYELFSGDVLKMTEAYFESFCDYIIKRKPDIIGHFDYMTKYDETHNFGFLENDRYKEMALKYTKIALNAGSIFEVNTGVMARKLREKPFPHEDILDLIQKENGKIILSSDSHEVAALDYAFAEIKYYLKSLGFKSLYTINDGKFIAVPI